MPRALKVLSQTDNLIRVDTGPCLVCHQGGEMAVRADGYAQWQTDTYIQVALPELSAGEREQLMTGTHPACFDAMFAEDER